MVDISMVLTISVFAIMVILLMWRPKGINEYVPPSIGAGIFFLMGIVPLTDVYIILGTVSGAAMTIISTIIMSIVLESIGFFRWAALNLTKKANGSGLALFWYINFLCFSMTLFFNNDGSILITTPIIIQTLTLLNLKTQQKIPYLLSGAIVATGASAPVGVSNLANLIALKIVGLNLNDYATMMFVPSMIGIGTIVLFLYLYFRTDIPRKIPILSPQAFHHMTSEYSEKNIYKHLHPLSVDPGAEQSIDWKMFRYCIMIVILIRMSFFAVAPLGISTELPAIIGAILLITVRWIRKGEGAMDIIRKTPWHIIIFAFSMYVIIYGLHNVGLTNFIVERLRDQVSSGPLTAIFVMGILLTVMSNLCNNLPAIMIGTLSLTEMNLDLEILQVAYLANVIGADIGALLFPMGTLASLIWMFMIRKNKIPLSWGQYIRVTFFVIPPGLIISLLCLYFWTEWLFF